MRWLWSAVTVAKVGLFFLNIYVLTMVVVVILGKWPVFRSNEALPRYDDSHLIVNRELNSQDAPRNPQPAVVHTEKPIVKEKKLSPFDVEMQDRVETLNYWCDKIRPQKARAIDLDVFKLQHILVDDKHKMLYCQIPEIAHMDWLKIFIFLTGKVKVKNHLDISSTDAHLKYSKYVKKLSEYPIKERQRRINEYYKFVFVREPIERLVSVYKNKFFAKYSKYFHHAFGINIVKRYRKHPSKSSLKNGDDVTFPEFIQFLVDSDHQTDKPLNEHWQQFYKLCHPCLIRYDFVGKFETLQRDMEFVLKKTSAFSHLKPPLLSYQGIYSQNAMREIYRTVSATNLRKLWKMYYPDYNLFSYHYPAILEELLKLVKVFEDY